MPIYSPNLGPYDFFDFGNKLKSIKINVNGVVQTVKEIYINVGNVLKKVKKVFVVDYGYPSYVLMSSFDDSNTLTFDLNDGITTVNKKPSGTSAPCLYEMQYLNYFTCRGSRVYLPIGWAGKISFWQATDLWGKPSNTPNSTTQSWFTNNTINAGFTTAFYKNSAAVPSPISTSTQKVLPATAGLHRSIPIDGVIADWASTTAAPSSIVNSAHATPYINADGTFFSFNKHHVFTALQDNIYGIINIWYGASCSSHTSYQSWYGTLRMAVTTTSTIQPIIGTNNMSPASSGIIYSTS